MKDENELSDPEHGCICPDKTRVSVSVALFVHVVGKWLPF